MQSDSPCVHCGLCLDTCATYRVLGTEADSPRGRVYIMAALDEGSVALDVDTVGHLDRCLGCLACETACPSGVRFGSRIDVMRPRLADARAGPQAVRAIGRLARSKSVLHIAIALARVADRCGFSTVRRKVPWLGLLPATEHRSLEWVGDAGTVGTPRRPSSPTRGRVVLFHGCIATTLRPSITKAAAFALQRNGFTIVETQERICCGALALHDGATAEARNHAAETLTALDRVQADFIVTTAAGCGAMIKHYGALFADEPTLAGSAERVTAMTRDVCELLAEAGLVPPHRSLEATVAYHDACHLLHAGAIHEAPRIVVEAATGTRPVDLGDNMVCCGSAGSYNLRHHRLALEIGRAKGQRMRTIGTRVIAVANLGCIMQLERAAALEGIDVTVKHPVELLGEAYAGH